MSRTVHQVRQRRTQLKKKEKKAEEDISEAASSFSDSENLFYYVIGLMFGSAYRTYQNELINLYRKVDNEFLLLEVFEYYLLEGCHLDAGLITRVKRVIKKGWNSNGSGSCSEEYLSMYQMVGVNSPEDADVRLEKRDALLKQCGQQWN